MGRIGNLSLAALGAFASVAAQAADYTAPHVQDVHGWKVVRVPKSCGMSRDYPAAEGAAPTSLMIVAEQGRRTTHVVLTNAGWTAETDKPYTLEYHLGAYAYRISAVGLEAEGASGFAAIVSENFLYDLAYADGLAVRKDGALMSSMSLRGGYDAIGEFRECVAAMRAQETGRSQEAG